MATILEEAAHWASVNGFPAWEEGRFLDPEGEGQSGVREDSKQGTLYLIICDAIPVGTFALRIRDDLCWPEMADDALYLHRFAVRRAATGAGRRAIVWITEECRRRRRAYLRLYCLADNEGMCRYYATIGFAPRGTTIIDGRRLRLYEIRVDD